MGSSIETLAAAPETPSLLGAALRMGLLVALMAAGAWAWFWWQRRVKGPQRMVEVLDRAFLARGSSVALLRVDERRLLVGVSPEGIRLLRDLDAGRPRNDGTAGFPALLADAGRGGGEVKP